VGSSSAPICPYSRRKCASVWSSPGFSSEIKLQSSLRSLPTGVALNGRRNRAQRRGGRQRIGERGSRIDRDCTRLYIGERLEQPAGRARGAGHSLRLDLRVSGRVHRLAAEQTRARMQRGEAIVAARLVQEPAGQVAALIESSGLEARDRGQVHRRRPFGRLQQSVVMSEALAESPLREMEFRQAFVRELVIRSNRGDLSSSLRARSTSRAFPASSASPSSSAQRPASLRRCRSTRCARALPGLPVPFLWLTWRGDHTRGAASDQ
jgi:hypothetical protein